MIDRIREWFTPESLRIARAKRRLEKLLTEAGLSRTQRMRIVSDFFIVKNDHK